MAKKDPNVIIIQGCPLWMLTMGDCMSLLLTFFVMLMSFSTPNADQLSDAVQGMKGALGIMPSGNTPAQAQTLKKSSTSSKDNNNVDSFDEGGQKDSKVNEEELAIVNLQSIRIANRFNEFKERLLEFGFNRLVMADQINRGIVVVIPFDAIFEPGSGKLKADAFKLLEPFANLAGSIDNEIQLISKFNLDETGSAAVSPAWELAQERVFAVSQMLINKYRLHESRFTFGYEVAEPGQKPALQMIIAEKLGISKVSIKELLNLSKDL